MKNQYRDALTAEIAARAGVAAPPDDLMLQLGRAKALHRAGMQIGAQTSTKLRHAVPSHPIAQA